MPTAAFASDLLAAVKTVWTGAASLASINGPYRDTAPTASNLASLNPYCIVKQTLAARDHTTATQEVWRHVIEFSVYETTAALAEAAAKLIKAVFDATLPTVGAGLGAIHEGRCINESCEEEDRGTFRADVTYQYRWNRPRLD